MEELRTLLAALERDAHVDELASRFEALDRIDALLAGVDEGDTVLRRRALATVDRLEALNAALFAMLREDIRGRHDATHLMACIAECNRHSAYGHGGYDLLDGLLGGVLDIDAPAMPSVALSTEMVAYQPTPARHILAMIRRSGLGAGDVLVDLGSGLGHVPLLAAICTQAQAVGVELEPAYVACARAAAAALDLRNVRFVQGDARTADFSSGTVFYLYTPFKGGILGEVLERLRQEAMRRPFRVCTLGPCTAAVAMQPWLSRCEAADGEDVAVFRSGDMGGASG